MQKTIVVADALETLPALEMEVISFEQYLADYPKLGEPRTRVINLCDTEAYLSRGYYCSLLAESRNHRVLPTVNTINDLRYPEDFRFPLRKVDLPKVEELAPSGAFWVYFGWTVEPCWRRVGRMLFERHTAPVLRVEYEQVASGLDFQVSGQSIAGLGADALGHFHERLRLFTEQVWRTPVSRKKYRWSMLMLYDPAEVNGPSDKEAIRRFLKAAGKLGIEAEVERSDAVRHLSSYDALFIRETTRINHASYRLARKAELEGLIVIDDSTSILRCCNKIYQQDAFTYNRVSAPRTLVVASAEDAELERVEAAFGYPVVIKMPESSFSVGVHKAKDRSELRTKLAALLAESALVLVQEYLFTEFDWRIGVLNGRAIYACKYYMARDHWQIYNHASKRHFSGNFETLPTFETPQAVLEVALRASAVIGRGLYGVDLKQRDNRVYVIEVNDNPNIDHGVEDQYLGDELYMIVLQEFVNRLEQRGRG